jgi:hypothetical protein
MGEASALSSVEQEYTTDPISLDSSNFFYDVGLYFPKAAILSLYFELFPFSMPRLRMALYIVTGYTTASGLTTLGINTFYCPNVPDNWSREEGSCSVINSLLVLQISWALNFSSDISSPYHIHAEGYHANICLHVHFQSSYSHSPYSASSNSNAANATPSSSPSPSASSPSSSA